MTTTLVLARPNKAGAEWVDSTTIPVGGGGALVRRLAQTYAAGSHTYTPGASVKHVEFEGWGAGGGAGQFTSHANVGGGGGAYCFGAVDITAGDSFTVVVGAGGTGSTSGSSTNGGDSTVTRVGDSHVVIDAGGGKAGDDATNGGGGPVNVADFGIAGEINQSYDDGYVSSGAVPLNAFLPTEVSGRGGNSPRGGFGGRLSDNFSAGEGLPTIPGGGGGAQTILPAGSNTKTAQNGADGQILVWEWS